MRRRAAELVGLIAVVAVAAFLRFDGLGRPSYWLDEILGDQLTTSAAAQPWWHWITGLEREHGPLYYATQLATHVAGHDEFAGRLAAALLGVATIPLIALVAYAAMTPVILSRRSRGGGRVAGAAKRGEGSPAQKTDTPVILSGVGGGREAKDLNQADVTVSSFAIQPLAQDDVTSFSAGPPAPAPSTTNPATLPAALAAAALLAVSPLHVYYSREARPYALLLFLTAALLVALLQTRPVLGALSIVSLLYTSAVAAPVVAAAAVASFVATAVDRGRRLRSQLAIGAVALAALAVFPLIYGGTPARGAAATSTEMSTAVLTPLLRSFVISAKGGPGHDSTIAFVILFAMVGALAIARRNLRAAVVLVLMTVLMPLFTLASLSYVRHWFAVRYFAPGLIPFLVLAGAGIAAFAAVVTSIRLPKLRHAAATDTPARAMTLPHPSSQALLTSAVALLITAAIGADTWSAARREPFQKLDWRAIAATLEQHVHSGDTILTAEPWSDVCLRYYLRHLPPNVRTTSTSIVPFAQKIANRADATWFVTAGTSEQTAVREWMCRFPLLLASPLEGFRLHYGPSAADFVQRRGRPEDLRAMAAALGGTGFTIRLATNDDSLLGTGWSGGEGKRPDTFRWAVARTASISLPMTGPRPRTVRFYGRPVTHPSLPPQELALSLNGTVIGSAMMSDESREYAFAAPANAWRDGANSLVFSFSRVNSPASLIASSTDTRTLAAAIEWIAVSDDGASSKHLPVATLRLASDALFATRVPFVSRRTKYPRETLDRTRVEPFLGRLGFDPATTWPHLAHGEVHLEDVADSLAWDSACEDPQTFVNRAFAVIAERAPNPIERRDLIARQRTGTPRTEIVHRILRVGDFVQH